MNERLCREYPAEMTKEDYQRELKRIIDEIEDDRILRYFYIYVSEKVSRVL